MEVSIHQNCNFKIVHCCKIHTYSVANVFLCLSCIMLSTIMLAGAHGATSGGSAGTVVVRWGGGGVLPAPCEGFKWTRKAHNITVDMKSSDA